MLNNRLGRRRPERRLLAIARDVAIPAVALALVLNDQRPTIVKFDPARPLEHTSSVGADAPRPPFVQQPHGKQQSRLSSGRVPLLL
jgi:hypothetical protein